MGSWNHGRRGPQPPPVSLADDACLGLHLSAIAGSHADALMDTVEHQIIPRLMLLHRQVEAASGGLLGQAATGHGALAQEVESFTRHLLQSHDAALHHLQGLADRGVTPPALCLDLMAPAARRLGELWCADLCDFTQVTIALGRLQGLLRGVAERLPNLADAPARGRSALFLPAPGEQHTLGLSMVRDFFLASGWDVWGDEPATPAELLRLVAERRFDLVGFSIGGERHIDELAALIARVRRAAAPRPLRILVGGPLMLARPELLQRLGADATAEDARQAILAADTLMNAREDDR